MAGHFQQPKGFRSEFVGFVSCELSGSGGLKFAVVSCGLFTRNSPLSLLSGGRHTACVPATSSPGKGSAVFEVVSCELWVLSYPHKFFR